MTQMPETLPPIEEYPLGEGRIGLARRLIADDYLDIEQRPNGFSIMWSTELDAVQTLEAFVTTDDLELTEGTLGDESDQWLEGSSDELVEYIHTNSDTLTFFTLRGPLQTIFWARRTLRRGDANHDYPEAAILFDRHTDTSVIASHIGATATPSVRDACEDTLKVFAEKIPALQ